jgi:hypothetical protein
MKTTGGGRCLGAGIAVRAPEKHAHFYTVRTPTPNHYITHSMGNTSSGAAKANIKDAMASVPGIKPRNKTGTKIVASKLK